MAQQITGDVDSRYGNYHSAETMHIRYYIPAYNRGPSLIQPSPFNDAPVYLLSHFTGRDDQLDHIAKSFATQHGYAPTRLAIHGMSGIGKTQLAVQYAKLSYNRQHYSVIFWISGATVEKVNQGFARILTLVEHPDRDHPEQSTRLALARRWLEENTTIKWLLILDNVVEEVVGFLKEHFPNKNVLGNILLTTRSAVVAEAVATGDQHQIFDLRAPDLRDATDQFLKEARIDMSISSLSSMTRLEDLVTCVGCLPLAISHIASFAKPTCNNLDDVLAMYQGEHRYEILSWENRLSSYEQKSIAITFSTQLQELDRQSPTSSNLLKVLSFFDPESIPLNMIVEGAKDLQLPSALHPSFPSIVIISPMLEPLITLLCSPMQLRKAISQLCRDSLVKCESTQGTSTLRIHDLVQFMIQEIMRRDDKESNWFHIAVGLACVAFRQVDDPASYKCWAQCEMLSPHIRSLSKWRDEYDIQDTELGQANLGIARYMSSRGRYSEAEALFRCEIEGRAKLRGPDHSDTLRIAEELAIVYSDQGRYDEAQILLDQTLANRVENLGSGHLDTLGTVHNLAYIYKSQGQYKEAEKLFSKALAGREKGLGPEHPDTLGTVHYLGLIYRYQGRISEAEKMHVRALKGREKVLGREHQDTLKTMNNLATIYQHQGRYVEGEKLHRDALEIKNNRLGSGHPSTLVTVDNLAVTIRSLGRYAEAEELFRQALAVLEKVRGLEHPDTLKTVHNLAVTQNLQERYDEAGNLYKRALAGREKSLGHNHPHTLETVRSLADFFQDQNNLLRNCFPLAFDST